MPTNVSSKRKATLEIIDLTSDNESNKSKKSKKSEASNNLSTATTINVVNTTSFTSTELRPISFKLKRFDLSQFGTFNHKKLAAEQTQDPNQKIYAENKLHHEIPSTIERNTSLNHSLIEAFKDEIIEEMITAELNLDTIITQDKKQDEINKLHQSIIIELKTKTAKQIQDIFSNIINRNTDNLKPNLNKSFLNDHKQNIQKTIKNETDKIEDILELLYGNNNQNGIIQFIQYEYKKIACIELMLQILKGFNAKEYKKSSMINTYIITSQLLDKNIAGGIYMHLIEMLNKIKDKNSENYKAIDNFIKSNFI